MTIAASKRLLHELQHRIKNNFSTIASLVRMRARETVSEEVRAEQQGISERIDTLCLIHRQLHASGVTDCLELRPNLVEMVDNLSDLHQDQLGKIRLDVEVDEVAVSPDTTVPLGLILNEFVTNSLKHAFDGQDGAIRLHLQAQDGHLRIQLSDNGKGLLAEPHLISAGSGLKLIDGLAWQLGGRVEWSATEGTLLRLDVANR